VLEISVFLDVNDGVGVFAEGRDHPRQPEADVRVEEEIHAARPFSNSTAAFT
jgi:hypothetical protein